MEMDLRWAGKGYVLGVISGSRFWSWGTEEPIAGTTKDIAAALPASRYIRLSAGDGTKGPRVYDWPYLELADLDAEAEGYPGNHGIWTRGLLVRRSLTDRDLAFFTTGCPQGTSIATLVQVEGCRWAIEDALPVLLLNPSSRPTRR
jgi:SRSO17 transposase